MADNESNNGLYFIVGALVVVAVLFGFYVYGGGNMRGTSSTNTSTVIDRSADAGAANDVAPAAGTSETGSVSRTTSTTSTQQ